MSRLPLLPLAVPFACLALLSSSRLPRRGRYRWRAVCGPGNQVGTGPNAHRANATDKDIAIDTIPIANDIVAPVASRMPQRVDAQSIGRSDARSRPATGSHGGNAAGPEIHTTAGTRSWGPRTNPSTRCRPRDFEETSSILGMADAFSRHVLGNGGLPDINAELEQFATNPRCTPKRVLNTHVSNELTNLQRSLCRPPRDFDFHRQ